MWCILSGSTLDSANLVSHTATVFRILGFSSRDCPVINNHTFIVCGTRKDSSLSNSENMSGGETATSKSNRSWLQVDLARGNVSFFTTYCDMLFPVPPWDNGKFKCLLIFETINTTLRYLARITWMFTEKELRTESHILKDPFMPFYGWIVLCFCFLPLAP